MDEKIRPLYFFILVLGIALYLGWNNLDTRLTKIEDGDRAIIKLPSIELRKD
jgi:hypothetical protein